jgi:hypothetical protein
LPQLIAGVAQPACGPPVALPATQVRYEALRFGVDVPLVEQALPNLPRTLFTAVRRLVDTVVRRPEEKARVEALNGLNGVLRAGSATLLLGAPGSGAGGAARRRVWADSIVAFVALQRGKLKSTFSPRHLAPRRLQAPRPS